MVIHPSKISYHKFFFSNYSTRKDTLTNKLPLKQCPKSVFQKMWSQEEQHQRESYQKCKSLRPSPDLVNQVFWKWDPAICGLTSPAGDSKASQNLRAIVLGKLLTQIHVINYPDTGIQKSINIRSTCRKQSLQNDFQTSHTTA